MGQLENWKMTPLDALLCSNQLQILKILILFFPPARQRQMILIIKLMELKQCLSLPLTALSSFSRTFDPREPGPEIFESICPYCDQEKQQSFRQMQNAFQMMKTFQQFSDSGMFDNLGEMMGNMGNFKGMENFRNMADFGNMTGFGTAGSSPQPDPPDAHSDNDSPPVKNSSGNDQLVSMLSSMMNPEQRELFAQYESMLDGLQ